jgi:hypothetical protein
MNNTFIKNASNIIMSTATSGFKQKPVTNVAVKTKTKY